MCEYSIRNSTSMQIKLFTRFILPDLHILGKRFTAPPIFYWPLPIKKRGTLHRFPAVKSTRDPSFKDPQHPLFTILRIGFHWWWRSILVESVRGVFIADYHSPPNIKTFPYPNGRIKKNV